MYIILTILSWRDFLKCALSFETNIVFNLWKQSSTSSAYWVWCGKNPVLRRLLYLGTHYLHEPCTIASSAQPPIFPLSSVEFIINLYSIPFLKCQDHWNTDLTIPLISYYSSPLRLYPWFIFTQRTKDLIFTYQFLSDKSICI